VIGCPECAYPLSLSLSLCTVSHTATGTAVITCITALKETALSFKFVFCSVVSQLQKTFVSSARVYITRVKLETSFGPNPKATLTSLVAT
jgi:hypothetical protein